MAQGVFSVAFDVAPPAGGLAAGVSYFSMRNTGTLVVAFLQEILLKIGFVGTDAATRSRYRWRRFSGATPVGGTALTPVKHSTAWGTPTIGDVRVASTGTGTFTSAAPGSTLTSTAHGLAAGQAVTLTTTGTLPAGLSTGTVYYVRDVTANTFALSATYGGAAISVTDDGTGTHSWNKHGLTMGSATVDSDNLWLPTHLDKAAAGGVVERLPFGGILEVGLKPGEGLVLQSDGITSGSFANGILSWLERG